MADAGLLERLLLKDAARKEASVDQWTRHKRKAEAILASLLPMQRDLVEDEHKRIALLTPGRTGKTFSVRGRLFKSALTVRDSLNVYIGLTKMKARQEIWEGPSGIVNLCERLGLKEPEVTFNRQEMLFRIPAMGSTIMCGGADDRKTIEIYRGGPGYEEVWIDEAKSHDPDLLDVLIDDILTPRINARNGVLGICGTPGSILRGQFYDITRTGSELSIPFGQHNPIEDLAWAMHRWDLSMNTTKVPGTDKSIWELALRTKRAKGWTDRNPKWMREYLGMWAADDTDFVYRYRPHTDDGAEFNTWTPAPPTHENPFGLPRVAKLPSGDVPIRWQFAVALDFGEKDPCALEVFAFAEQTRRIYQVHEFYQPTKSIDLIASELDKAVRLIQRYADYPVAIVGDMAALGGYITNEILLKTGHKVSPANKVDKLGFMELVNGDLVDGRIKLLRDKQLAKQMSELQWDEKGKRENKSQRNDCCDCALYARGAIIRFLTHTEPVADAPKSAEVAVLDEMFRKMAERSPMGSGDYELSSYEPD